MYNVFILQYRTLCYPAILAISKSPKDLPNCLKIFETSVILIVLNGVIYDELILLLFLSVALHESGTRNALLGL